MPRFEQILADDVGDVAGRDAGQVEDVGDGEPDGIVHKREKARPGTPAGPRISVLRAPDVKRPAETGTDSGSLPSDLSNKVSASLSASLPVPDLVSGGEELRGRPTVWQTPNAESPGAETPRSSTS